MSKKSEYKFPAPYFPDWDEVSNEYEYRAFDEEGELFYYNKMPVLKKRAGVWGSELGTFYSAGKASNHWSQKIWRDSLEKRPE